MNLSAGESSSGALEKDHDFVSLTNTVKAKLASIHVPTCKQECCSMRPLDFLPAANAQRLEHEVAQLRLGKQGHFEAAAELGDHVQEDGRPSK